MANQKEIIKYQEELKLLKGALIKYRELFNADGTIDAEEQAQLDTMQGIVKQVEAKLLTMKSSTGIPSSKKEFLDYLSKQEISFQCNFHAKAAYKGVEMNVKIYPKIFIAPQVKVEGYLEISLEGVEKLFRLDEKINSNFKYDIGSGNIKFNLESAVGGFKLDTSKDLCSVEMELDIMEIITGAATTFLKTASQGVLSVTTSGKMHLNIIYNKKIDKMYIGSVGGKINLGAHATPSKQPQVGKLLKKIGQDPKIQLDAIFDVKTVDEGTGISLTTAKGKAGLKMINGDKVYELSKEGEGQAKGSDKERVIMAENALLEALQDCAAGIQTVPSSIKEKVYLAKKINGIFKKQHAHYRQLAEEKLEADGEMEATNTTLNAYLGLTELYDIYSDSVSIKFDNLINPILKKDSETAKLINSLKCAPAKLGYKFSTKRADDNFMNIKIFTEQYILYPGIQPDNVKEVQLYLARIDVLKKDYPEDCEQKAVVYLLKRYVKRLKELELQFNVSS